MASTVAGVSAIAPYSSLSTANSKPSDLINPKLCSLPLNCSNQSFSAFRSRLCITKNARRFSPIVYSSSPVVSSEYLEEPQTKVKFQTSLSLPGCSSSLSLLGTGYREKVFAIIGVKVYAAGLYANPSIFSKLDAWKGRSSAELQKDSSLFDAIYQAPLEKSLHIILVRDLDGKTFWDALDEALSPRIKSPTPVDETALSTFRGIFQGRPLQKGTSIFLTWLDTAKMLVFVTPEGTPSVDAAIESSNVTSALFDVFLGGNPVSPSLKASACIGLAAALK
ncbi:fatty-acid-binding protein 3, chloroplastic [Salvia hispanica]|uniref:fatty-acid-binding protein 3, chloroplastic n=1 Tax=Salvia hispanica TaxID=49212 RepID=UPI0020094894|nr:fatty-acid-binding protein 3, chloroplastic [Salvia hispanica]